jgi:hypothetical protein
VDQHFRLNMPEHVNTFRIVGIVRDAKFAGFALDRPTFPMFFVPLAQSVDYKNPMMKRIDMASHFIGGLMLVSDVGLSSTCSGNIRTNHPEWSCFRRTLWIGSLPPQSRDPPETNPARRNS